MSNKRRNERNVWEKLFAFLRGRNSGNLNLLGADLTETDLTGADLTGANLYSADLNRANLNSANLTRANLRGANLRWTDLTRADLNSADLNSANLTRANLHGANLRWTDLTGADLHEANLTEADLRGANLRGADLPESADNTFVSRPRDMTSTHTDVEYCHKKEKYRVSCFSATPEAFIAKTLEVCSPKQARQIFYRCLSFGDKRHEKQFLEAIENLAESRND